MKTINYRDVYFGKDKAQALERFEQYMRELKSGITSAPITVEQLCNRWLTARDVDVQGGELAQSSFDKYRYIARVLADTIGRRRLVATIKPDDLHQYRRSLVEDRHLQPASLKSHLTMVRMLFAYAHDEQLIAHKINVRNLRSPSKQALKKTRSKRRRALTTAECLELLRDDNPLLRAWVLFALNGAFGPQDLATLDAVHIKGEWMELPRPKTQAERKCWIWPECRQAMQPPWGRASETIRRRLHYMLADHGIDANPYSLRHTSITAMSQQGDMMATKCVSGHSSNEVIHGYIHHTDDERIRAVCMFARGRLLGGDEKLRIVNR